MPLNRDDFILHISKSYIFKFYIFVRIFKKSVPWHFYFIVPATYILSVGSDTVPQPHKLMGKANVQIALFTFT